MAANKSASSCVNTRHPSATTGRAACASTYLLAREHGPRPNDEFGEGGGERLGAATAS